MDERVQVVVLQTSSMNTGNLKSLIYKKMQHTYIESYIKTPIINDDKLFMLTSILDNTTLSQAKKENYIVTTMVVQMALDTHDSVPNTNDTERTNKSHKSKQLSVLAGDYYSGLYYLILSEIEDIDMIRTLAAAIKEINEYKMRLYYKEFNSFQAFMDLIKKLEALLILSVAEFVGETTIKRITAEWLLARKLMGEKQNLSTDGFSQLFESWSYPYPENNRETELRMIDHLYQDNCDFIESSLETFPENLTIMKTSLLTKIQVNESISSTFAEEG